MLVTLHGSSELNHGIKNIATAGTDEALHTNLQCREVTIIAKDSNTGFVYVGGVGVSSASYGAKLPAGASITLAVHNLNLVYLDVSVNGEGVSYLAI